MILPPEILARLSEDDLASLEAATNQIAQSMSLTEQLNEELGVFVQSLVEKYEQTAA